MPFLESVKRDGIPYELITKALPKIEAEINNVLNQIVEFNMVMNTPPNQHYCPRIHLCSSNKRCCRSSTNQSPV